MDSKKLTDDSDPFLVHIILGGEIRALENELKLKDEELDNLIECSHQNKKEIQVLKSDLKHEKYRCIVIYIYIYLDVNESLIFKF